jgi:nucleotide-binding universal stress UspA family protein
MELAVALAETNQASLTVMAVVPRVIAGIGMPEGGPISANLQTAIVNNQSRNLEACVRPYRQRIEIETQVLIGTHFLEVIREVLRNRRDLVIKSPEQQEWLDRVFGSDDMHLLRKCPCPVWLVRPRPEKGYRRILAAVDLDDDGLPKEVQSSQVLNRQILEMASSLALAESAELHIVYAWEAIGESLMRHGPFLMTSDEQVDTYVERIRRHLSARLDSTMADMKASMGEAMDFLHPQTHLVKGWARKEIPALARHLEIDLVVMGTVARTGMPGFIMGNTAETILNQLDCSVLAIKPPGFVTPVTLKGEAAR